MATSAGALALYALAAIGFSYPLVWHAGAAVVLQRSGDAWAHLWNLWWVSQALRTLHNPFRTPMLFFPREPSLYFHALNPLGGVIGAALQPMLGLVGAFNLEALAAIALTGWGAWLLAGTVAGDRRAALPAGLAMALSPIASAYLNLGQLELLSTQWLPLGTLALLLQIVGGTRRRALAAALLVCAAALTTWYYALYLGLLAVLLPILLARRPGDLAQNFRRAAVALGLALLLLSPLLFATLRELRQTPEVTTTVSFAAYNSADLLDYVVPLAWRVELPDRVPLPIPLTVALLAVVGTLARWRAARPWVIIGAVFLVLSLGPYLQVGGIATSIPLPFRLLLELPGANVSRVPLRFSVVVFMCLAVLAALGLAEVRSRLQARGATAAMVGALLPFLAFGLILAETWSGPRQLVSTAIPNLYASLRAVDGAVLELPYGEQAAHTMYLQTGHGRPLVGGYLSRHVAYDFPDLAPVVRQLVSDDLPEFDRDIIQRPTGPEARAVLRALGIDAVVWHPDWETGPDQAAWRARSLDRLLAGSPRQEGDGIQIYLIEGPPTATLALELGSGWYAPEYSSSQGVWRWSAGDAELGVVNPSAGDRAAVLRGVLYSYDREREVRLLLDGKQVGGATVGPAFQKVEFPVLLPPGLSRFRLKADVPAASPSSLGLGRDGRLLSFGAKELEIVAP